jgi:hypothetical protein
MNTSIGLHETGHALGLDHLDDPDAAIWPSPGRTLGYIDIAAIQPTMSQYLQRLWLTGKTRKN